MMADKASQATSGGLAAILIGITFLATPHWVGASHIYEGNNWVEVLKTPIIVVGSLLLIGGASLLLKPILNPQFASLQQRLRQFAQ